ncbi:MAG: hypothetical protein JWQ25_462 [Daejeonella sp.]|nr:hypothetical protein [Daejeonella sp.]
MIMSCEKSSSLQTNTPGSDTLKGSSSRPQLLLEFNANYKKWQNASIKNYKITEKLNCFCVNTSPHEITVVNNAITKIQDEQGRSVPFNNTSLKTIEELFTYTETSLKGNFAGALVKYNTQYGYPESVYFDFNAGMADEEMGYIISKFSK